MAEELVFTKIVDMSSLNQGISIPVSFQPTLYQKLGFSLYRGEQRPITIRIDDYVYDDAIIKNQEFDPAKYHNRNDIVQIRYSKNSLLVQALRDHFPCSASYIDSASNTTSIDDTRHLLVVPENQREYIALYADKGVVRFDCISRAYTPIIEDELPQRRETHSSTFVRSASVAQQAKQRAQGVCQLCGNYAPFVDKDGEPYLEVHHIKWLSRGGVDKIENAIALCPNCHSKMHVIDDHQDAEYLLKKAQQM